MNNAPSIPALDQEVAPSSPRGLDGFFESSKRPRFYTWLQPRNRRDPSTEEETPPSLDLEGPAIAAAATVAAASIIMGHGVSFLEDECFSTPNARRSSYGDGSGVIGLPRLPFLSADRTRPPRFILKPRRVLGPSAAEQATVVLPPDSRSLEETFFPSELYTTPSSSAHEG